MKELRKGTKVIITSDFAQVVKGNVYTIDKCSHTNRSGNNLIYTFEEIGGFWADWMFEVIKIRIGDTVQVRSSGYIADVEGMRASKNRDDTEYLLDFGDDCGYVWYYESEIEFVSREDDEEEMSEFEYLKVGTIIKLKSGKELLDCECAKSFMAGKVVKIEDDGMWTEDDDFDYWVRECEDKSRAYWISKEMIECVIGAENKMNQVAALFGLELDQEFYIEDVNEPIVNTQNPFKFTKNGLINKHGNECLGFWKSICKGEWIISIKWNPEVDGQTFYFIDQFGNACKMIYDERGTKSILLVKSGNAFETEEKALENKNTVMKEVYHLDEWMVEDDIKF